MSSNEDLGPMDDDLRALLRAERSVAAPAKALDRSWDRIAASIAVGGGGGGGGGGNSGPNPTGDAARALATPTSRLLSIALASFVAGGISGAGLYASLSSNPPSPAPAVIRVEATSVTPTVAVTSTPAASVVNEVAPVPPPPSAIAARAGPRVPAPAPDQLEQERADLDQARTSLSQGDAVTALAAVARHERSFSHPQLAEEREAIAVQALVLEHSYDEARARAARFHTTWPNSLFAPAIDASVGSIP